MGHRKVSRLCYTWRMNSEYLEWIIKLVVAIAMAVLLGNGSVVWFNRMPVKWFRDPITDTLPESLRAAGDDSRQRLTSSPWKYVLTAYFGAVGVFLALRENLAFEVAAILVLFLVLEMAVADSKYRIVPDQLAVLLAVSAVGFVGFHDRWWEPLAGALLGLLLGLSVYGLGRLLYRKDTIGGADLKFYLGMGLIVGRQGIVAIFLLIALFSTGHLLFRMATKRYVREEQMPMLPYALGAVTIYLLFLRDVLAVLRLL